MGRTIHPLPVAYIPLTEGNFGPAGVLSFPYPFIPKPKEGATVLAVAAEPSGAIIIKGSTPIAPLCSLCSIAWPEKGARVFISDSGTTSTETSSAVTRVQNNSSWSSDTDNHRLMTIFAADSRESKPYVLRRPTLPVELAEKLPVDSPRASSGQLLIGSSRTEYIADAWNISGGRDIISRREVTGILASFPLHGVEKITLSFRATATISGTALDGTIKVPLRACIIPVKGNSRLYEWPTSPIEFDAADGLPSMYGSGLIPPITCDVPVNVSEVDTEFSNIASLTISQPATGLALIFAEIDQFAYGRSFAPEMMRTGRPGLSFENYLHWEVKIISATAVKA